MSNIEHIFTINAISYARSLNQMANMGHMYSGLFGMNNVPGISLPVLLPVKCPCCGCVLATDIIPIVAVNNIKNEIQTDCKVMSLYRCTSCNEFFVVHSENHCEDGVSNYDECVSTESINDKCSVCNIYTYPFDGLTTKFEQSIIDLSPMFVMIYHQAERAEVQGLDQICGMGYRRALEFLINDYIKDVKNIDNIPEKDLSKRIDKYIDDSKLRELAKKSAWLGNDATHIINKHPERTVYDMKKFIIQIVKRFEYELVVVDAETIEKR